MHDICRTDFEHRSRMWVFRLEPIARLSGKFLAAFNQCLCPSEQGNRNHLFGECENGMSDYQTASNIRLGKMTPSKAQEIFVDNGRSQKIPCETSCYRKRLAELSGLGCSKWSEGQTNMEPASAGVEGQAN